MDSGKILILSISGDKIPGLDIDVVSADVCAVGYTLLILLSVVHTAMCHV